MNPTIKKTYTGGEVVPAFGTDAYKASQALQDTPPTTPSSTLVDRYATNKSVINNNPALNVPAPDQGNLREQYRGYAQSTIDAIRSTFDRYINEDTKAKKDLVSKTYLNNLASGMSGSPTGATSEFKAAETGQKKIREDEAKRDSLINEAISNADLRASQEFDKKRAEWINSQKDKAQAELALSGNIKAEAEKEIGNYANKYTYDEWKNTVGPDKVNQYAKETGLDESGLKSLFLKNVKKDDLLSTTGSKNSDGSVSFYKKSYDSKGNITDVKEVARIEAKNKPIKSTHFTDNGIQILYEDGTYETRNLNAGSSTAKQTKPPVGVPKGFTTDDIKKGREILTNNGVGGFTSPSIYTSSYQAWVNNGGTSDSFLKLYPPEEFVNPREIDLYPTFLRPKADKVNKTTTPSDTERVY